MATEDDARALWEIWSEEHLGEYEGRWIAFRAGESEFPSATDIAELVDRFNGEISEGRGPLFAFVTFEAIA